MTKSLVFSFKTHVQLSYAKTSNTNTTQQYVSQIFYKSIINDEKDDLKWHISR